MTNRDVKPDRRAANSVRNEETTARRWNLIAVPTLCGRLRGTVCFAVFGLALPAVAAADEAEILKITVGTLIHFSKAAYQNSSAVAVSRTGTVAMFYPDRTTWERPGSSRCGFSRI